MKIILSLLQICIMLVPFTLLNAQKAGQSNKLHIIIIGAHPDDPDEVREQPTNGQRQVMMF
jgi:hypothetical protein